MIVLISDHATRGYATIACPPAGNDLFRHTSAVWDQPRRVWLVQSVDVEALTQWLRQRGHAVVDANATHGLAATHIPPFYQLDLGSVRDAETARRGAALCRAALRNASHGNDNASTMSP